MINVALIGAGYWGSKYKKVLESMEDVNLKWVHKRNLNGFSYKGLTNNINDILNDKDTDCVIIATPAYTHYTIAKQCIEAGKSCLIEKPFTLNSRQAQELIDLNKDNLLIMPGHIYLHHPGIKKLKEIIDFDEGKVFVKRMNQSKYKDALSEIVIHDIYILEYLFGKPKVKGLMGNTLHAISNINFGKMECFIESAADYPGKIREMIIKKNKSNKRIIFDETMSSIDLKFNSILVKDLKTQKVNEYFFDESISPLELQCKHFFDCVEGKDTPIVTEQDGLETILTLEKLYKLL